MTDPNPQSMDAILASIRASVAPGTPRAPTLELDNPLPPGPHPADASPNAPALTVEALARELLAPALNAWLDANLPEIVQREVAAAVERMTAPPPG